MTKKEIHKIELEGETIHLRNSKMGWKVVHPLRKEDGRINWFNLITGGSWIKFVCWIIFFIVAVGLIFEYTGNMQGYANLISFMNDQRLWEEFDFWKEFGKLNISNFTYAN